MGVGLYIGAGQRGWGAYNGERDEALTVVKSSVANERVLIKKIDSDRVAILYQLTDNSGAIELVIVNITTGTIGTPVVVKSAGATLTSQNKSLVVFSSGVIGVAYAETTNGQILKSYTLSGTTATLDATLVVDASTNSNQQMFNVGAFSSTRAIAFYWNGSAHKAVGITRGSGTLTADGSTATPPTILSAQNTIPMVQDGTGKLIALLFSDASTGELHLITDGNPPTFGTSSSLLIQTSINTSKSVIDINDARDRIYVCAGSSGSNILVAADWAGGAFTVSNGGRLEPIGTRGYGLGYLETDQDGTDWFAIPDTGCNGTTDEQRVMLYRCNDDRDAIFGGNGVIVTGSNAQTNTSDVARISNNKFVVTFHSDDSYPSYMVINK